MWSTGEDCWLLREVKRGVKHRSHLLSAMKITAHRVAISSLGAMPMFTHERQTYQPSLTAAAAREHINDLLRAADQSRDSAQLPARNPHPTPRRRLTWWWRLQRPARLAPSPADTGETEPTAVARRAAYAKPA